jgi:NitT/TauT family transport system substrate-binding protein
MRLTLFISRWLIMAGWLGAGIGAPAQTVAPMERVGLKKAVYIPHWTPQAQFAGYYVALEKGFFRAQGIDLEILRGGPDAPATAWLEEGKADFATMFLASAIERRAAGAPFVNLAQVVQRSALLLVAKKSSGIKSPADFNGRRIMVWPEFQLQPLALFRKFNVHPRVITQRNTVNLFLRGGADVVSAMWYNEYHLLLNYGLNEDELTVFHYDDYGLNFPEDGIYCRAETWQRDPALCRGFVRAAFEGWRYAFAHPEEALDMVMTRVREANLPTNRVHQRWMLGVMRQIIMPAGNATRLGHLAEADYERVARELRETGIIADAPAYKAFYEDGLAP